VPISLNVEARCVETELLVNCAAASTTVSRELIVQTKKAVAESRRLLQRSDTWCLIGTREVHSESLGVYLIRGFGESR
jgi:hypothetical protein